MHEWALAESVVETVKKELSEKNAVKVEKVLLHFGELQDVDEDVFRNGLSQYLAEDSRVPEEAFVIETEPAEFSCTVCGAEWSLDSVQNLTDDEREAIHFLPESAHVYISCPRCGSPDFRLTRGRGVSIASIEFLTE
jgi:hydrogenase nickel incorporation protein HypA/HybF